MPPTPAPVRRALLWLALATLTALVVVDSPRPPRVDPGASWPVSAQASARFAAADQRLPVAAVEPSGLSDLHRVTEVVRFVEAVRWSDAAAASDRVRAADERRTRSPAPVIAGRVGASVWDDLAECEASGDWSANTGNGFEGGLQFTHGTWVAYGGAEFASHAYLATREQQIIVAERVRDGQGWEAWPACSRRLALR